MFHHLRSNFKVFNTKLLIVVYYVAITLNEVLLEFLGRFDNLIWKKREGNLNTSTLEVSFCVWEPMEIIAKQSALDIGNRSKISLLEITHRSPTMNLINLAGTVG